MRQTYPIILSKSKSCLAVYIPDFEINTEGKDYAEAISMARDAIGMATIVMQDESIEIPAPTPIEKVKQKKKSDIVTLVDIDFEEYRRQSDIKTVRRNVSLQSWLDYAANKAGLNVSAICQRALMEELQQFGPKYVI
ncbi:MAG: type II toxin-antitoxin system HicB family antitoxin [Bacillota bacterium]|nr:type II toxin-antitoxin system HicB family antitoxin [Bacillota bacterium]